MSIADFNHRTKIRTRKHVRKSLVTCKSQLGGGLLLKKLKYFEVMLKFFELLRVRKNVESSLSYANKFF